MNKSLALLASAAALGLSVAAVPATAQSTAGDTAAIYKWHDIMLDVHAVDFRSPGSVAPQQGGPTRTSRAFAMVQIAVFDAVNAFDRTRQGYNSIPRAGGRASRKVAIAYAAHDVLVHLFPAQTAQLAAILAEDLGRSGATGAALNQGRTVGQNAAAAIIERRTGDGSEVGEVTFGNGGEVATGNRNFFGQRVNGGQTAAPRWSPDPVSGQQVALGSSWGAVEPFVLVTGSQFRARPYDAPGTRGYLRNFNDVRTVGEAPDGPDADTDTKGSTEAGIFIGNFWGYDGVPRLGVPPRLYGQIAEVLAARGGITDPVELARFFALIHISQGDSGIAAWDSKYFYNLWRPSTGVPGNDGDPNTDNPATWFAVGVSMVNVPSASAVRATPPFPAYPSGHATFGAAIFETARGFMPENTSFTFVSDEYNGVNTEPFDTGVNDPDTPRPLVPVRYRNLTAPTLENARSRILNGVHWQFDADAGIEMGISIARYARANLFQARR
jgi:hypothetical protein